MNITFKRISITWSPFSRNQMLTHKKKKSLIYWQQKGINFFYKMVLILGLNKFFVFINIANFDFSPYKIKLNVFILTKKFILFFVPNENLFCFSSLMLFCFLHFSITLNPLPNFSLCLALTSMNKETIYFAP